MKPRIASICGWAMLAAPLAVAATVALDHQCGAPSARAPEPPAHIAEAATPGAKAAVVEPAPRAVLPARGAPLDPAGPRVARVAETPVALAPVAPPAAAAAAGMVVAIDPETGALTMPAPEQSARFSAPGAAHGSGARATRPAPVYHADGSVSMDVRGWMREHTVVRVGPAGTLIVRCVDDPEQARRAMKETSPSPATPEEK